jgi:hypothetical protein
MKKLLWLSLLFSILFVSHTFAAALSLSASGTTVTGSMTGGDSLHIYQLILQTTPFASTVPPTTNPKFATADPTVQSPDASGLVKWSLQKDPNTTYYGRVLQISSVGDKPQFATTDSLQVATGGITVFFTDLTTEMYGNNVIVRGTLDPVKNGSLGNYSVSLDVSTDQNFPSGNTSHYDARQTGDAADSDQGISTDGTYHFYVTNLGVNKIYYFRQIIKKGQSSVLTGKTQSFNSSDGVVIAPTAPGAAVTGAAPTSGYTLLSKGFPGLTFLPDPDTCAAMRADALAKGVAGPKYCDLNDVLNYFLKLLIGISGVVLVFRLMAEGFVIMTSDLPFKISGAKGNFLSALLGLLLVMTSYIILNTVNPKLVNEDVSVQQLAITIDGDANTPTVFVSNTQMSSGVICPGSGRSSEVQTVAKSFIGRVTYKYGAKSAIAQSDGKALLDCSAWANTVLKCSGYATPKDYANSGSADIFSKGESLNMASDFKINGSDVLVKNIKLNPGDLVGWTQATSTYGHVILYVGNATFMDSHSSKVAGGAIGTFSASQIQSMYGKLITSLKRTPL